MNKIILYYKFTPLADPHVTMLWQRELCTRLNLKGRILVSKHGINGTLGGSIEDLREYKREMNRSIIFTGITYKWSDGTGKDFPKLKVKVKEEIVAFGAPDEIIVTEEGVVNGGTHLKPVQVNKLVEDRGDEVIFYDGRNMYEAQIGRFKNTIIPKTRTSRDFIKDIEEGEISKYKDRPIVSYCTGGIRCEILSAMMKNRGYQEVYQIDGGIVKYGEKFKDDGLWEGKLFVFDDRMKMGFSEKSKNIAVCEKCAKQTSNLVNSTNVRRKLHVVCEDCASKQMTTSGVDI